jgi:hypothetical protein
MRRLGLAVVFALGTVVLAPRSSLAQETITPRTGFMMSARVLTPWIPVSTTLEDFLNGIIALPRFIVGAQIRDLGIGAGVNYFSFEDTTLVLFGPTVTYAVAKGAGGRTQLHLLGSFSFATGEANEIDVTAFGLDVGVLGRGMVNDAFGLDVGLTLDFISVTAESRFDPDDEDTDQGVQLVAFLGGTFVL